MMLRAVTIVIAFLLPYSVESKYICNLCRDGSFPGKPNGGVTVLQSALGLPKSVYTCQELYTMGRQGKISERACNAIVAFNTKHCQCGKHNEGGNNYQSWTVTTPFGSAPVHQVIQRPVHKPTPLLWQAPVIQWNTPSPPKPTPTGTVHVWGNNSGQDNAPSPIAWSSWTYPKIPTAPASSPAWSAWNPSSGGKKQVPSNPTSIWKSKPTSPYFTWNKPKPTSSTWIVKDQMMRLRA